MKISSLAEAEAEWTRPLEANEGSPEAFFGQVLVMFAAYTSAATACGLQMVGGLQMPGAPGPRTPDPSGMNGTGPLTSNLSGAELSCLSETGDPQQLMALMDNPEFASQQERDALARCLEHETLLKIFLKGFTDQTGPLSSDTSACVSDGFRNIDLHAMMLTNPEGPGAQAAIVKGMAGILITLSCLNEDEWKATSPALDQKPEGREALQCATTLNYMETTHSKVFDIVPLGLPVQRPVPAAIRQKPKALAEHARASAELHPLPD